MHELRFFTSDPFDHCARLLDAVRRMGFDLIAIRATPVCGDRFDVWMTFRRQGALSPYMLADRVAGFVGVDDVRLARADKA